MALSPDQRRRLLRMNMLMAYASFASSKAVAWTPATLFANAEVGGWYDPSDLSTLFQDAAGTTPVTAVEQPVGLVLDKSKGAVGMNGSKRLNLISWSEAFDNAAWTKVGVKAFGSGSVVNSTASTDPLGTNTAEFIQEDTANNGHGVFFTTGMAAGRYTFSCAVKATGRNHVLLRLIQKDNGGEYVYAIFDLSNGSIAKNATVVGTVISNASASTPVSLGNGWYRISITATSSATFFYGPGVGSCTSANPTIGSYGDETYTGDGTSGLYLWGADLRLTSEANTSPTYQRITADWPSTMSGNHLSQSTSTARPVLSARVNLLTRTEEFDNAAWDKTRCTVTPNDQTAPDGTQTVDKIVCNSTSANGFYAWRTSSPVTVPANTNLVYSLVSKKGSRNQCSIQYYSDAGGTSGARAYFDLNSGTFVSSSTFGSGVSVVGTPEITSLGNGLYRLSMVVISNTTTGNTLFLPSITSSSDASCTSGVDYGYAWGADLRPSSAGVGLPSYQRVGAATSGTSSAAGNADYDTTGFPLYLKFDGTDDQLVSSAVTIGSVDKAQIFAGVRKLSDPAEDFILSYSSGPSANGIEAQCSGYYSSPKGFAVQSSGPTTYGSGYVNNVTAPTTKVYFGSADRAQSTLAATHVMRLNGVQQTLTTNGGDPSGNFGSYPIYVGSRSGAYFLNGHLYSLILRFSATNMDAATIASTETWVNNRTKAY